MVLSYLLLFFFFNDTATTEIYTLSLHDALPIWIAAPSSSSETGPSNPAASRSITGVVSLFERATSLTKFADRKSTRLNSSHQIISYAVFCLKKKKNNQIHIPPRTRIQHAQDLCT